MSSPSFVLNNSSRTPLRELGGNAKRVVPKVPKVDLEPDSPPSLMSLLGSKPSQPMKVEVREAVSYSSSISSASTAVEDNLLQAKIDHLEKERKDLSLQLHQRSEKDRSRKIKMERLENSLKEMAESKSETDTKFKKLQEQYDNLAQQLQTMEQPIKDINNESNSNEASVVSQLADQLANPPSYLASKGDPATGSLWTKMTAASKELRRMEEQTKTTAAERDASIAQLSKNNEEMLQLRDQAEKDRKAMIVLKEAAAEADSFMKEIDELNRDNGNFAELLKASIAEKEQLQQNITKGMQILDSMKNEKKQYETDISAAVAREATIIEEVKRLSDEIDTLQSQISTMREDTDEADSAAQIAAYIAGGGDAQLVSLAEDLRARLNASEKARKKLHAEIQELKGNVRVLVRVRPFLPNDGDNRETALCCNKDETSLSCTIPNKPANLFHFDHVFSDKSTQDGVYKEVSELIQSSMDGYRVCIFSYGQTGSGKTWTMSGERSGPQRGIIPRAVQQIIEQAISLKKQGWTMNINVSVVELYNEELKDLLVSNASNSNGEKLNISTLQNRVTVAGLSQVEIDCSNVVIGMNHLEQVLEQSNRARTTVATGMNERSSRSHMVFMVELNGIHADGVTVTHGGLRLVDLAGSERLDRTGTLNDAARLKETVNINKSLSCLADVFINLQQKSKHIPYRNSKLTMLLQDCLSGTGKSLMIANLSPTQASSNETLCTMRFADQVSQVELGKAQKQMYMQQSGTSGASSSTSTSSSSSSGLGKAASRGPTRAKRNVAAIVESEVPVEESESVNQPASKRSKLTASRSTWKASVPAATSSSSASASGSGMWKK
jgi:kinesin family member C1